MADKLVELALENLGVLLGARLEGVVDLRPQRFDAVAVCRSGPGVE
ncbi:MAG: hypothetical protein H0V52_06465 [Acidimicrobiia bacterium]|nr:hypothetical protein [Acidimicrobiia bacterium]